MLSIIEKVITLESQAVFSTLTLEHLSQIAELTTEVAFKKGDVLFREGEPADSVFFILKGQVHLKMNGILIRTLGENGPCVGGLAIFTDTERQFTAETAGSCLTLRLLRDDFLSIMQTYQDIPINILKLMAQTVVTLSLSLAAVAQDPLLSRMGLYPPPELPAGEPSHKNPANGDCEDNQA